MNRPGFVHASQVGKDVTMRGTYDPELKAKAVRLYQEHVADYPSEWAAMKAISGRLGMTAETLRKWVRQCEVDAGERPGLPSESA
jgi:transposase